MLNHHSHPTYSIQDTKTNAFNTSMASPSRQHNFTVKVSHKCIVIVAEFGRSEPGPTRDADEMHSRVFQAWAIPL